MKLYIKSPTYEQDHFGKRLYIRFSVNVWSQTFTMKVSQCLVRNDSYLEIPEFIIIIFCLYLLARVRKLKFFLPLPLREVPDDLRFIGRYGVDFFSAYKRHVLYYFIFFFPYYFVNKMSDWLSKSSYFSY